jgi:hypothetical protein
MHQQEQLRAKTRHIQHRQEAKGEPNRSGAPREETDDRDEYCRANYRPDDGKVLAAYANEEEMRQVERVRKPNPDDRAYESERNRNQATAVTIAGNRPSD